MSWETFASAGLRLTVRTAGALFPEATSERVQALVQRPPRSEPRSWERVGLAGSRREELPAHPQARTAGPLVARVFAPSGAVARGRALVTHGWGGRASQLVAFVPALLALDLEVWLLDLPGHGESPGRSANLFEFERAVHAAADAVGGFRCAVAHSFGGAACALAVAHGLELGALVSVAAPARIRPLLDRAADRVGLSGRLRDQVFAGFERRLGRPLESIEPLPRAADRGVPLLVLHDPFDLEVDFAEARAYRDGWPGAQLVELEGSGHRRILRDPRAIERAARFIGRHLDPAQQADA